MESAFGAISLLRPTWFFRGVMSYLCFASIDVNDKRECSGFCDNFLLTREVKKIGLSVFKSGSCCSTVASKRSIQASTIVCIWYDL